MKDLLSNPYNNNLKLASFDITNMYTNIPTDELPVIIQNHCTRNNINMTTQTEIIHLCDIILNQNYFHFNGSYYLQNTGLAMGAPTSSIFSEIYLQYLENTILYDILIKHIIIGYFRYVDEILTVYNEEHTDIHRVLHLFNTAALTLSFTIEKEKTII